MHMNKILWAPRDNSYNGIVLSGLNYTLGSFYRRHMNLLFIDDNLICRRVIRRLLHSARVSIIIDGNAVCWKR